MSRPRILLVGPNGQVGWELQRSLAPLAHVLPLPRAQADLADAPALQRAVTQARPDLVVNAAAYTAVDRAEDEPDLARRVNALAPEALAKACADLDIPLLHYSTDYVFDGSKRAPYTEADVPAPINLYGATKLEGEQRIQATSARALTLRISWVYAARGNNFARTMLRLAQERDVLRVVSDQIGAPTWARSVADASAHAALRLLSGWTPPPVLHLPAGGRASWFDFAALLVDATRDQRTSSPRIEPISSEEYPTRARRPHWSVLDGALARKELGLSLPDWQDMARLALADPFVAAARDA